MALGIVINEIRRLSQEEGLNDREIAEILECNRATVNRNRIKYNIGPAKLENRKDKIYTCGRCKAIVTIRRKEKRRYLCPECEAKKAKRE